MAGGPPSRPVCPGSVYEPSEADSTPLLVIHYHTFAYSLVIGAYVFGFGEYIYFRLTSILHPEKVIYHSMCEKRVNEVVGKNVLHYVIVLVAFVSVAFFQIVCFFGLTISEKWTYYPSQNHFDPVERVRISLAKRIRAAIRSTVYPAFVCYGISAVVVCAMIFYMVGVRDSIDEIASSVSLYVFDFILLIYFLSFPIIAYIYHPYIRRSAALAMMRMNDGYIGNGVGTGNVHERNSKRLTPLRLTSSPSRLGSSSPRLAVASPSRLASYPSRLAPSYNPPSTPLFLDRPQVPQMFNSATSSPTHPSMRFFRNAPLTTTV